MKNIFTIVVLTFFFVMILASCKKQVVTNTVYLKDTTIKNSTVIKDTLYGSVVGFWAGTFASPGDYPSSQFSYLFRSDGSVTVYIEGPDTASAAFIGEGQYQVIDSLVITQLSIDFNYYSSVDTIRKASSLFFEGTIGQGLNTSGWGVNIAHKE
jgi:hypothetical protein